MALSVARTVVVPGWSSPVAASAHGLNARQKSAKTTPTLRPSASPLQGAFSGCRLHIGAPALAWGPLRIPAQRLSPQAAAGKMSHFKAERQLVLPLEELEVSVEKYIDDVENLVFLIYPKDRVKRINDRTWGICLPSMDFLGIKIVPIYELVTWAEEGGRILKLDSSVLKLDTAGLPDALKHVELFMELKGTLTVRPAAGKTKLLDAEVVLIVNLEMPSFFNSFPENAVTAAGNGILSAILLAVEMRMKGATQDYPKWVKAQLAKA
eukprot:jgi/Mesvir1/2903/Mv13974-RA.1